MSSKVKSSAEASGGSALVPKRRFPEFIGQQIQDLQLADVTNESTERNGSGQTPSQIMGVSKVEGIVPMEERIVAADTARYKLVRKDWFAYNPMRLNIGSIARWQGENEILVSPDYVVFKCKSSGPHRLDPVYLDHFRRSEAWEEFVSEKGDGSVRVRIYYKDLARLQLALPSYPEQQKIADCLDSLDALIEAQARKVEALRAHKKGLMQQLFPEGGETQPRRRFPEFRDKEEWREYDFPEVIFFQEGPGIMAVDFRDEGVPLVRLSGLSGQKVTLEGCNYLDPDKVSKKWAHFRLEAGDILASCSASFGRPAIVNDGVAGAVFYTGLIRFKAKNPRLDARYLEVFLGSPIFSRQAEAAAVGGGIRHFGPTHLREMKIPLPPDVHEQQRIADCLTSLDDLITAESRKLDTLKTHKRGLMQQLFPLVEEDDA